MVSVDRSCSQDATLASLLPSAGTLTPSFSALTLSYTDEVANSVASVTMTPTVAHPLATVRVNGYAVKSGETSPEVPLPEGTTKSVQLVVTPHCGTPTKTYQFAVTRAASSDAGLKDLDVVTGGYPMADLSLVGDPPVTASSRAS